MNNLTGWPVGRTSTPSLQLRAQAEQEKRKRKHKKKPPPPWPTEYVNSETGKRYSPHHADERSALYDDATRYILAIGGEGGGKSVFGIVKSLNRLRRGMSGVMVSKDFEHFKKSLWPEFRRWIPWEFVVERHRYRQAVTWEPSKTFQLVFDNAVGGTSVLICGGMKESEVGSWEGPNVNFAHMDEMRHHKTAVALKTMDGRVRIPGPHGEPPQMWLTTTPRKHWLYEYFGGARGDELTDVVNHDFGDFRENARVIRLLTADNEASLEPGFAAKRALTLTSAEARVLLKAAWEDIENTERFLESMLWWDACRCKLPPLGPRAAMVLAMDAASGREDEPSDCFGIVGVTSHPARNGVLAVRFTQAWQAAPGQFIDFQGTIDAPGPEMVIRELCKRYNVVCVTYDPTELHDMCNRLRKDGVAWFDPFPQQSMRYEADKQLLDKIRSRGIAHDGDETLRQHIDNANRKLNDDGKRLRIVKRYERLKIDLAVALSMAQYKASKLNL